MPNVPPAWKNVGWVADGNDIYIIYSGDLRNPDGTAMPFSISLKFTGRDGWKIKKVAENTFEPPVGTYTKTGVAVSATAKVTVPYTLERKEQEMSGNVFLVAVETKVNDTLDQKDDLIAVSLGRDEDLATDFSIRTNCYGLTASLAVKPGDGDIKFKDTDLTLQNGAYVPTKLWGITPSSAVDKTIIVATIKKNGKAAVDVEENCTVFKGVTLEIKGTFSHATNSIPEGWRPSPYPNDPSQNPSRPTSDLELAAAGQDSPDISGALSFTTGDHDSYTPRSWARSVETTIMRVSSQEPNMELEDFLVGCEIHAKNGVLLGEGVAQNQVNPGMEETWALAEIILASVASPGQDYLSIKMEAGGTGILKDPTRGAKKPIEYFNNLNETDDNSSVAGDFWKWFRTDPQAGLDWASEVSGFKATLECESFDVSKGSLIKKSIAAKGFFAATAEDGKQAKWSTKLGDFNIWWLSGAAEGTISTP